MTDPQIKLLWVEITTTAGEPELQAAAAAFALVTCVDHEITSLEAARFKELVPRQGRGQTVRTAFDAHARALLHDYKKGRAAAFEKVKAVSGLKVPSERVLRIAQMAIVADGDIDPAEESMVQEIAAALDLHHDVVH